MKNPINSILRSDKDSKKNTLSIMTAINNDVYNNNGGTGKFYFNPIIVRANSYNKNQRMGLLDQARSMTTVSFGIDADFEEGDKDVEKGEIKFVIDGEIYNRSIEVKCGRMESGFIRTNYLDERTMVNSFDFRDDVFAHYVTGIHATVDIFSNKATRYNHNCIIGVGLANGNTKQKHAGEDQFHGNAYTASLYMDDILHNTRYGGDLKVRLGYNALLNAHNTDNFAQNTQKAYIRAETYLYNIESELQLNTAESEQDTWIYTHTASVSPQQLLNRRRVSDKFAVRVQHGYTNIRKNETYATNNIDNAISISAEYSGPITKNIKGIVTMDTNTFDGKTGGSDTTITFSTMIVNNLLH